MNPFLLTSTTLVYFALFAEGVFGATSYPNNPYSKPPSQWSSMENKFEQHCSPYGISIFAKDWPRDKFLHACNMLAQLLDNDQDGCADDANVVKTIRASQSGMAMFATDKNSNYDLIANTFNAQPLYSFETKPGCSGSNESQNCRDAAIEEIFHLVTQKGLSPAYPTDFGECDSKINNISAMQFQMDIARGGHFVSIPNNYPGSSIYHYDDKTCDYSCMTTEFIYWSLTSLLNGQDSSQISEEWEANTPAKLQSELPDMVNLLRNHPNTMVLLSSNGVLPGNSVTGATGTYSPPSMTCSNGCGLDGSGCGSQGNSFDLDICSLPPVVPIAPTPPTPPTPSGGNDLNGEEACENKGFTKNECKNIGNGNSCCEWDSGGCWSGIGKEFCPGTGTQPTVSPQTPPKPITNPTRAPQRPPTPIPTKAPQPSPTPVPMTPKPPPGSDDLNGEEACENNGFTNNECKNVGNDNSCCVWDIGECWSTIGRDPCPGTGTTLPPPSPPTNGSCVDSPLRFKLRLDNGKSQFKDCAWVANDPSICTRFGKVISHCPETCGECATCKDAPLKFKVTINGNTGNKNCKWVRKNKTEKKCDYSGVRETCRKTCNGCE